ncbi:heterokaryon incompatibility protein-domain-containing protein [Boeremia exigua]|uniref:heterokaryon incompatibility protein-domain-containing protein n=1 Tax=Boeremia exigua TaxID=749465 RepID=UPI001E8E8C86|nr:heterokaryon incompatibility protein-domain-containing protein [Boeremia exigua]KAH6618768.1 heterokaryon incompatibility protein-domain-containing protein [Boeremia exigua]
MQQLFADYCGTRPIHSPIRNSPKVQPQQLGTGNYVYDSLPSPTSIRVLLLAPGDPDDDIFCYLTFCDLEKDCALDPSIPSPVETPCFVTGKGYGDQNETKTFELYFDTYTDKNKDDKAPDEAGKVPVGTVKPPGDPGNGMSVPLDTGYTKDPGSTEAQEEDNEMIDRCDPLQQGQLSEANGAFDSRVRLHPFQRYTALSYVWGSLENPAHITLDGYANVSVTRNMHNALRCLRRPDRAVSYWVDAICINQSDPEEKKIQIGLMRRVYKQAHQVIAYVPQNPEDDNAFNGLAKKIYEAGFQCREVIEQGVKPEDQQEGDDLASDATGRLIVRPLKPTGTCIEDYDVPPEDDPVWFAWRRFFASPYFRRIWILQEYTLGSDLYVHNGISLLSYPLIYVVMDCVKNYSRMMNMHYLGRGENAELTLAAFIGWNGLGTMNMERLRTGEDLRDKDWVKNKSRLIDKIWHTFKFDATDPRDKIYALLGLASDAEHFGHLVSYQPEDTYPKVYTRFTKAFIEQGHLVEVLSMACMTPVSPLLPSWVPDWFTSSFAPKKPRIPLGGGYRAGGNITSVSSSFVQNQLILSGQVVTKFAFMTSPVRKDRLNAGIGGRLQYTYEMLLTSLKELTDFLKQKPGEILESFFHCITMRPNTTIDDAHMTDLKDQALFLTLLSRIDEYKMIEDRMHLKITFGAFPEEDVAFLQRVMGNLKGRCFCVTSLGGQVGLVAEQTQLSDCLAIIKGAPVPFLLREANGSSEGGEKVYNIVGDAYVLGLMGGEHILPEDRRWHKIVIV